MPWLSSLHLVAPDDTHSTAISQLHEGHQHDVMAARSIASEASASTSRVALRKPPALANPSDLEVDKHET